MTLIPLVATALRDGKVARLAASERCFGLWLHRVASYLICADSEKELCAFELGLQKLKQSQAKLAR